MNNTEMQPLPLWKPSTPMKFNTGMEQNAPFIVTQHLQRSDLGLCIISTTWPHFVAKIRAFKTKPDYKEGKDGYNQKQLELAEKQEKARLSFLETRFNADVLGDSAAQCHCTIKEFIETPREELGEDLDTYPRIYDEEFDEPRIMAKVPGLNVYLELFGCMDDISEDEVPWKGYNGAYAVLERMSVWAQNIWNRADRRPRATQRKDHQPLVEWHDEYDETLRPAMPPKRGIGIWPDIDESRRPELLHSKAPKFDNAAVGMDRVMKAEKARLAAQGIKE